MEEIAFGIVKPDAYDRRKEIEEMIEKFEVEMNIIFTLDPFIMTEEKAREHYKNNVGKHYYERGVRSIIGPTCHYIILGENAVQNLIKLSGPTDPIQARKLDYPTIRGKFGVDIPQDLSKNVRNAFHRSDSKAETAREIKMYFPWEEIPDFVKDILQEYEKELV